MQATAAGLRSAGLRTGTDCAQTSCAMGQRVRNTQPEGVPEEHIYPERTTPAVYLRVQALSRIVLDNVQHIQTSYVTWAIFMPWVT